MNAHRVILATAVLILLASSLAQAELPGGSIYHLDNQWDYPPGEGGLLIGWGRQLVHHNLIHKQR